MTNTKIPQAEQTLLEQLDAYPRERNSPLDYLLCDAVNALFAANEALTPQAASEGFVLVPREPTLAMIRAAYYPDGSQAHMLAREVSRLRREYKAMLAAATAIAPGGDGMSAWIGKLGALVSAAKDRDLSAKDHAEAIANAHSELFDTLLSLPAAGHAVTVDDAMRKALRLLRQGLYDDADDVLEAALAPSAQQDGHMELAVAIAAAKTADPPTAAHGYNCGVNDAIVGECSCSLKTK